MRALLAARSPLSRAGLRYVVERGLDASAIDEAAALGELTASARRARPDLVMLDLGLPELDGFDGLRRLRQELAGVPIVVLGRGAGRRTILQAIESGAHGFVPDDAAVETIVEALKLVLAGNVYVPAAVLAEPEAVERPAANDDAPVSASAELAGLTPRQRQVLDLLVRGHSNREIAKQLGVAQGTVRIHVAAILRALNVRNRTQAALTAIHRRAG
jgi:DNA-binding NarL/FixJ family response regulator